MSYLPRQSGHCLHFFYIFSPPFQRFFLPTPSPAERLPPTKNFSLPKTLEKQEKIGYTNKGIILSTQIEPIFLWKGGKT